jgi:DNA-binding transcriptional regulator GbsR (MarR family)
MSNKLIVKTSGKSDKKNIYKIEKDFSINNIEAVKSEIDEIISKNNNFHFDIKNIENFDLSAVQLIYVLKEKLKDKFTYSIDIKEEISTILKSSGFENIIKK